VTVGVLAVCAAFGGTWRLKRRRTSSHGADGNGDGSDSMG
jgi:hypothetical protein